MIKLFASDLDGTLLNERHESDEIILNAIKKVKENNRYFTVATGRDLTGCFRNTDFDKMGIYIICMNGAYIVNPNQEIIFKQAINKMFIEELLNEFSNIHFDFITTKKTYTLSKKEDYLKYFASLSIWNIIDFSQELLEEFTSNFVYECKIEDILAKDILKINCRIDDKTESQRLDEFINKYSHLVTNAPFDEGAYEITDCFVNKGNAVMFLADYLNILPDEVAVYGDGGNDLEMLSMFEHAYATKNACDAAKKCASQTIGHCKDHAVAYHIEELLK